MTLLDDYQAKYRLKGIALVSDMLDTVPTKLLKRTGIGELFATVRSSSVSSAVNLPYGAVTHHWLKPSA